MTLAGKDALVQISTDDITYVTVGSVRSHSFGVGMDLEDDTVLGEDAHGMQETLRNHNWTLEVLTDFADAQQDTIRLNTRSGLTFFVRVLPDGVNGYSGSVKSGNIAHGATFDGLDTETYTFENDGDWELVP